MYNLSTYYYFKRILFMAAIDMTGQKIGNTVKNII